MTAATDFRARSARAGKARGFIGLSLAALLAAGLLAGPAAALDMAENTAGEIITADKALRLAAAGEVVVVDVRSPQEWQQTGVPAGAQLVTIHQPDGLIGFIDAMSAVLGSNRDRPIALICARGNRSTIASSALAQAGYTRIYNVREGMFGSADGPGWLARGLPTDPCRVC